MWSESSSVYDPVTTTRFDSKVVAVASSGADSFITEGQVEEEVAHGLVGVPYHLAVVVTRLSKAQRMMWDKTTTKTSALNNRWASRS